MFLNYMAKILLICLISLPLFSMEEREQKSQEPTIEIIDANTQSLTHVIPSNSNVCVFGATPRFSQCQEYLWHAQ